MPRYIVIASWTALLPDWNRLKMTLEKARELLSVQADMGGGYNRNAARLILAEVQLDYGQKAVDTFIQEFDLDTLFGFKPATEFKTP